MALLQFVRRHAEGPRGRIGVVGLVTQRPPQVHHHGHMDIVYHLLQLLFSDAGDPELVQRKLPKVRESSQVDCHVGQHLSAHVSKIASVGCYHSATGIPQL